MSEVRLAGGFVAPEANRHVDAPAPDATPLEPADRDAFSPGFTPADIAQRRQASWQINPQPGEPKLENLNGDLVGHVERYPSARDTSHGAPSRFERKSAYAYIHQLTPESASC